MIRLLSVALLIMGTALYAWGLLVGNLRIGPPLVALAPLQLPPELVPVESLQVPAGTLTGRNLLLVTLDTTRADRLGLYGNASAQTPTLDRLGREGVVFSRAVATASSTLPTHASMLTGLYPHRHGAPANAVFVLDPDVPTLGEVLAERGYRTAAFISASTIDAQFGLSRGFDHYDDVSSALARYEILSERRADETTDRAIAWLERPGARPWFVWVHYFDPHAVYAPPEPHATGHLLAYDGEIAFVDAQLARLLEAARAASSRDPLVVVAADHGEALGEHGEQTHSYLVQEATLQIPLILHAGDALPGGRRIDARASQVDLMPTVLALLGIESPTGLDGVDWTHSPEPDRPVLAETIEGRALYGWSRLSALYQGEAKLVTGSRAALYDLGRDPTERQDLADAKPAEVVELERRLLEIRGGEGGMLAPAPGVLADDTIQRLAALGYVVTEGLAFEAGGPGPDPRDLVDDVSKLQITVNARLQADRISWLLRAFAWLNDVPLPRTAEETTEVLEAMVERRPDFAPAWYYLGDYYKQAGRNEDFARAHERLEALRRARATGPPRS
ncbi:MAG: sulfatase [Deltaproteobacteria bacterium]|nr:sulfatase [Deltaproteobacteria bacterium]MBW2363043.1 sulfatase [Deltaproteobacteria bacterium]